MADANYLFHTPILKMIGDLVNQPHVRPTPRFAPMPQLAIGSPPPADPALMLKALAEAGNQVQMPAGVPVSPGMPSGPPPIPNYTAGAPVAPPSPIPAPVAPSGPMVGRDAAPVPSLPISSADWIDAPPSPPTPAPGSDVFPTLPAGVPVNQDSVATMMGARNEWLKRNQPELLDVPPPTMTELTDRHAGKMGITGSVPPEVSAEVAREIDAALGVGRPGDARTVQINPERSRDPDPERLAVAQALQRVRAGQASEEDFAMLRESAPDRLEWADDRFSQSIPPELQSPNVRPPEPRESQLDRLYTHYSPAVYEAAKERARSRRARLEERRTLQMPPESRPFLRMQQMGDAGGDVPAWQLALLGAPADVIDAKAAQERNQSFVRSHELEAQSRERAAQTAATTSRENTRDEIAAGDRRHHDNMEFRSEELKAQTERWLAEDKQRKDEYDLRKQEIGSSVAFQEAQAKHLLAQAGLAEAERDSISDELSVLSRSAAAEKIPLYQAIWRKHPPSEMSPHYRQIVVAGILSEANDDVEKARKIAARYGIPAEWFSGTPAKTLPQKVGKAIADMSPQNAGGEIDTGFGGGWIAPWATSN